MMFIPGYKKLLFILSRSREKYLVSICPKDFTKVPSELIVEKRQRDAVRNEVELILRGISVHKEGQKRTFDFFTGLRKTQYNNVYDGDILTFGPDSKRMKNYILLRFSPNAEQLALLYIPGFRPYPDKRTEFIAEVVGRGLL